MVNGRHSSAGASAERSADSSANGAGRPSARTHQRSAQAGQPSVREISVDEAGYRAQHQRKLYDPDHAVKSHRSHPSAVREGFLLIFIPFLIMVLLRVFLIGVYVIPSGSMLDTLQIGDRIMTWKLAGTTSPLVRGDIIVFKDPDHWLGAESSQSGLGGDYLVKRLIGLPGDHVQCCNASGQIMINGHAINETSYLRPGVAPSDIEFDVTVTPGHLFVMGDNRPNSADSRYHANDGDHGLVPTGDVVGVAKLVYWPINRWRILQTPTEVFKNVGGVSGAWK